MSPEEQLASYEVYDKFCIIKGSGELCRYLRAPIRHAAGYLFQAVEKFETGERFEPRTDLIQSVNEMEVIAWEAKGRE